MNKKEKKLVEYIYRLYEKGINTSVYFNACIYYQEEDALTFWATIRQINEVNMVIICRANGGETVCGEIEKYAPRQSIGWVIDDFIKKYNGKIGRVIGIY